MKNFFTDPLNIIFTLFFLLAISTPFIASHFLVEEPGNFTIYPRSWGPARIQARSYKFEPETGYFVIEMMNGKITRIKEPHEIIDNRVSK